MQTVEKIKGLLNNVRERRPLIHHITNYVTVNDCANIVLSLGGSPVMADDEMEVEEMVSISSALVINMGTLNKRTIGSMILAGKAANKKGIPVIFDPVGIGATKLRTETAEKIIKEVNLSVIRGNMSEIKMVAGIESNIKGVDSTEKMHGGEEIAINLAKKLNCVIAITGEKDIVSDGNRVCVLENGHRMLADVTGTGCMTTSLIGTYSGITSDYYLAAISGILTMGLAGESAVKSLKKDEGIGTFKARIFDSIYNLTEEMIMEGSRIYEK